MESRKDVVDLMKALGAIMILISCGGIGFSIVAAHRRQEQALLQLIRMLEHMSCELQFRMISLPELCRSASEVCTGCVCDVLLQLGLELEAQITPDAATCMRAAIARHPGLPATVNKCMTQLGDTLGRFDLSGQLQGLKAVNNLAQYELEQLRRNQDVRLRSYQTLGLCAGTALVVLFL